MKKFALLVMTVVFMLSMVACGGKQESESKADDMSQTSTETELVASGAVETEESAAETESASEVSGDYSGAKAQIDAFNERIGGYTQDLIKKDDKSASWIDFGSNNDYENGGRYDGNWKIYVVNEETKQYESPGAFYDNYPKTEDVMAYDFGIRIGNGTYKIYAIYQNDDKGVYFYAEDEIVIDETTIREYKGRNSLVYNVTDLVGADFTSMTFRLDHE